ncbi:MAG: hypothetical protein HC930_03500 [Hydrococcus sp. SU_1_0]|nr:hypothetical protein [Hydrococcus sp. SU_1_0]
MKRQQEDRKSTHKINLCLVLKKNQAINSEEYHSLLRKAKTISILESFKEGIQSLQAAISSLMAQKLEDYFSYESLLEEILDAELPLDFSRIVPFGYTLPVTRNGRFFPGILEIYHRKNSQSNVRISLKFKKIARQIKEKYLAEKVYVNSQRHPGLLGHGCPLSFHKSEFPDTGIGYVMKAYKHVFKLLKTDTCDLNDILSKRSRYTSKALRTRYASKLKG